MPTLNKVTHKPFTAKTPRHHVENGEEWRRGKSSAARGYGYKWQKARAKFLRNNPLCVNHEARGIMVMAKVVDHVIDHKGDEVLFWDESNWQSLCISCHNEKTGKTRGKTDAPDIDNSYSDIETGGDKGNH